jgi:hypothetical protein
MERVRYFPRMLLSPEDMIAEQEYFRHKLRRHNRFLHGWGVVCGCHVSQVESSVPHYEFKVTITPGYILGPYGDEIIIWKELTFDIRTELICGCTAEPLNGSLQVDPWCSEVKRTLQKNATYYIAIRYHEQETRPVKAHPAGCSCGDISCETSRILDCFKLKALKELPDYQQLGVKLTELSTLADIIGDEQCPECPPGPWVVLAAVEVDNNGKIKPETLDNCAHRRMAVSFANFWWQCEEPMPTQPPLQPGSSMPRERLTSSTPFIDEILVPKLKPDEESIIVIKGKNFAKGLTVDLGNRTKSRVTLKEILSVTDSEIQVRIKLWANAKSGERVVNVVNPGGMSASKNIFFEVT